jgi:hypothetical protein
MVLGAEPCDGLFVGLYLGCRGFDGTGVDDRKEFRSCGEVENALGWIGGGKRLVGAENGDQMNMDLHRGLQMGADRDRRRRAGKKPREKSAATRW